MERSVCPICGGKEFELFMETKDFMITKESFSLVSCKSCNFIFTNPIPDKNEISRYYKSEDYVSHSSSKKGLINTVYNVVRKFTLKQKVGWIKKYAQTGSLLDVGCGTGHFLKAAQDAGYEALGLEPDEEARGFARKENEVNVHPIENLYHLDVASYDVITMWHVLEHVYELKEDLAQIEKLLKSNGTLFIAVPNCGSQDANIYKEYWAAYDVPRHLYHFRENDIKNLFQEFGMRLAEIIPMKFDAYYVSMLSEKYKNGNMLKALFNGLKSNLKAKKHGYSSQVYVLKKK